MHNTPIQGSAKQRALGCENACFPVNWQKGRALAGRPLRQLTQRLVHAVMQILGTRGPLNWGALSTTESYTSNASFFLTLPLFVHSFPSATAYRLSRLQLAAATARQVFLSYILGQNQVKTDQKSIQKMLLEDQHTMPFPNPESFTQIGSAI